MGNFVCIGLDGGATKISGARLKRDPETRQFFLANDPFEAELRDSADYDPEFRPVDINIQLKEMESENIKVTEAETRQENAFVETALNVIRHTLQGTQTESILIGMGLPGLKTDDKRGIAVMANGPRMPDFANKLEEQCHNEFDYQFKPIRRLGSDADYCGMGEEFARNGAFSPVLNAYYLGGGTGAADALKINGRLIPFDYTKHWLAKTWELKNADGISLERFASAGGIQSLFAKIANRDLTEVMASNINADTILDKAIEGDSTAIKTMELVADGLADLISERIETLAIGWQNRFGFVNPKRQPLSETHEYMGMLLGRIVIGQRLGNLLQRSQSTSILWKPLVEKLSTFCHEYPESLIRSYYTNPSGFRSDIIVFSSLRSAPVLGAGIDAWLHSGVSETYA